MINHQRNRFGPLHNLLIVSLVTISIITYWRFPKATPKALQAHHNHQSYPSAQSDIKFTLRHSFHHHVRNASWAAWYTHETFLRGQGATSQQTQASTNFTLRSHRSLRPSEGSSRKLNYLRSIQDVIDATKSSSDIIKPNVSDKETVINLAKMTSDAYVRFDPSVPEWFNLSDGFNRSHSFGWKNDGLRGHVFANADNSTVVVSFKGTTIDPRDKLRNHDKENDNVLFSCCCAAQRTDPWWYGEVCDCRNDVFSCNSTCLSSECGRDDRYYAKAKEIMLNVTGWYPHSQLWIVGHSLGGALASLMGMTFHAPAVTFEAVPERLPAQRLKLTMSGSNYLPAYHFGNTADPVWTGSCNGIYSACSAAGYAFESQCFSGMRCEYDTSGDKGWRSSVLNHRINTVIKDVLEAYPTVPNCTVDDECGECNNWSYFGST